jgi:DNA-binding transcriptional ArsR family regulator
MKNAAGALDSTFQALADPTRRALIAQLRGGAARVTDLAHQHSMSLNAVSKHIKVLEGAGLVERRIEGREHLIGLRAEPLADAEAWIEQYREFWLARLGRLDRLMKDSTR